jgi:hypothetical protein
MIRPASTTQNRKVTVLKIGEARDKLPQLVSSLESGAASSYVVGRYGKPTAAVVSYQRFGPMLVHGNKRAKLALLIVEDLLENVPQHIKTPAVGEVSRLPMSDLMALWRLDGLPTNDREAAATRKKLRHPEVFDRLLERARVARSIADARAAGLYDMAEHVAGSMAGTGSDVPE